MLFNLSLEKNIVRRHLHPVGTRRYKQYCMLAKALDVVGERWTMLIVRDLLMGPKRFKDLMAGLPGIGTNLLSARIKELEANGVVERRKLPPPASVQVWALTDLGEQLEEPVLALSMWGRRFMQGHQPEELRRPAWFFLALRRFYDAAAIQGVQATVVFELGEDVLFIRCDDGHLTTGEGRPEGANCTVRTDRETVGALVFGKVSPEDAVASGKASIDGDINALKACLNAFGG